MKQKLFSILTLAAFITLVFTSCSKDPVPTPTNSDITGKWKVKSIIGKDTYKDKTNTDEYLGKADDYVDFQKNGLMKSFIEGESDSAKYSLLPNNKIQFFGFPFIGDPDPSIVLPINIIFDIKTLTANTCTLYIKMDEYDQGDNLHYTSEEEVNLVR